MVSNYRKEGEKLKAKGFDMGTHRRPEKPKPSAEAPKKEHDVPSPSSLSPSKCKIFLLILLLLSLMGSLGSYIDNYTKCRITIRLGSPYPSVLTPSNSPSIHSLIKTSRRYGYGKRSSHNIYVIPSFLTSSEITSIRSLGDRVSSSNWVGKHNGRFEEWF